MCLSSEMGRNSWTRSLIFKSNFLG